MSLSLSTDGVPFNQNLPKLMSGFPLSNIGFVENVNINSKEIENKKDIAKLLKQFGTFDTNQIELSLNCYQQTKMCENVRKLIIFFLTCVNQF